MTLLMKAPMQAPVSTLDCSIADRKYTWIEFWNNLIEFSNFNVIKSKHIHRFKTYEDSFSGRNIVDTVFFYLYTCKNAFITEVNREKAKKLCELMLNCKIISILNSKSEKFEDSNNKIYKFNEDHEIFTTSDSFLENQILQNTRKFSKNLRRSSLSNLPSTLSTCKYDNDFNEEQFNNNSNVSALLNDDDGISFTSMVEDEKRSWRRRSHHILGQISSKCEKYWHHTTPLIKAKQIGAQKNKQYFVPFTFDDENDQNKQAIKEKALAELTKLLEIPLLDEILQYSILNPDQKNNNQYNNFFDDEKHNYTDETWMKGLNCLKFIDYENAKEIYNSIISLDKSISIRKLNLYNYIFNHYVEQNSSLWPNVYADVQMGLMRQIQKGPLSVTLHAFNLALVLLVPCQLLRLLSLLDFLKAVTLDMTIQLSDVESNRSIIIKTFLPIILPNNFQNSKDAAIFLAFLIDHVAHFCFQKRFELFNNGFACMQISKDKYENEKKFNTNEALVEMMRQILSDDKITLKDKKMRLKDFQKHHQYLFTKYFKDLKL